MRKPIQVIKASAGSGKTYTLAQKFILRLVENDDSPENFSKILAVTFTNDATSEMKQRVLEYFYDISNGQDNAFLEGLQKEFAKQNIDISAETLKRRASSALKHILHNYSQFNIGTIDGFFQRVLRSLSRELGVGASRNIDLNTRRAIRQGVSRLIREADDTTMGWMRDYVERQIDDSKSWNIKQSLEDLGGQLYNEFYQINHRQLPENHKQLSELLSLQIKKCREIKHRFEQRLKSFSEEFMIKVEDNGLTSKDFSREAVYKYYQKFQNSNFTEELGKTLCECLENAEKFVAKKNAHLIPLMSSVFYPLFQKTEMFRVDNMPQYNSALLCLKNIYTLGLLSRLSSKINENNRSANRFMLSDTAVFLNQMIDQRDAPFIFEKIGATIEAIMIDEFQDTSSLQWSNFKPLIRDVAASDLGALLVGDVKQSIYRWRNSDWRIMNDIDKDSDLRQLLSVDTLKNNYRSSQSIVEFNNALFGYIVPKIEKNLSEEYEDLPFAKAYKDVEQNPVRRDNNGFVEVSFVDKADSSEEQEKRKEWLLYTLKRLSDKGYPASDVFILCRRNAEIEELATWIQADQNLPPAYKAIVSDKAFVFSSSSVVSLIISIFRVLSDTGIVNKSKNKQSSKSIARFEMEWLYESLTKESDINEDFLRCLMPMSLYEIALEIVKKMPSDVVASQSSYVFSFLAELMAFQADRSADIKAFLKFWDEDLSLTQVPSDDKQGVRLMTVHTSKGLEAGTVLLPFSNPKLDELRYSNIIWCNKIPDNSDFILPIYPINTQKDASVSLFKADYKAEKEMSIMDELNTLYVAFTRARDNMFVFSHKLDEEKAKRDSSNLDFGHLMYSYLQEQSGVERQDEVFTCGNFATFCQKDKKSKCPNPFREDSVEIYNPQLDFSQSLMEGNTSEFFYQSNESRRFLDDENSINDDRESMIDRGNIMHEIFSRINTEKDVDEAIRSLVFAGVISDTDFDYYQSQVQEYISQISSREWLSGKYNVLNERTIIEKTPPADLKVYRPDRVMTLGDKAIVVDYKFGHKVSLRYNSQVAGYMKLLSDMGYKDIEGYVWYASERRIEEILL